MPATTSSQWPNRRGQFLWTLSGIMFKIKSYLHLSWHNNIRYTCSLLHNRTEMYILSSSSFSQLKEPLIQFSTWHLYRYYLTSYTQCKDIVKLMVSFYWINALLIDASSWVWSYYFLFQQDLPVGLIHPCEAAKKAQNLRKNRYKEIFACKHLPSTRLQFLNSQTSFSLSWFDIASNKFIYCRVMSF